MSLILASRRGLECAAGGFCIDPMQNSELALITHAHADHARAGSTRYIATEASVPILKARLGDHQRIDGVAYGESLTLGDVKVSFHPAGHVLGSAQIRVQRGDDVWLVSGDFKRHSDPTCEPFEVVPCQHFITEATFALPVYRWPPPEVVAQQIFDWWQANRHANRPSVLFCYAFGKAQRVLAELCRYTNETVYCHGAVEKLTDLYRAAGVDMLPTQLVEPSAGRDFAGELIIAPPGAAGSRWMRRFKGASTGFCSGWMRVRGNRRRRGYDRGFVLSDHADWPSLLQTIDDTKASNIYLTHGHADTLVRLLREQGRNAAELTIDRERTDEAV
ncbi:MAG: ligase-associated DNA damage response exonuclease [Pseudomonadota bacterium]